jgi:integrase
VAQYIAESISANTRRAYASDLGRFRKWGGRVPATDRLVASYLAAHAGTHRVATLARWLSSISNVHNARGLKNPARSSLVRMTMRGIKRVHGTAQAQATPLHPDDLDEVLATMSKTLKDDRDRALLLIGFAGGLRRSELVAINLKDIERSARGIIIHLRRSKTDQLGAGRIIGIAFGKRRHCPVAALDRWLARSGIIDGPVFRRVDRHGNVFDEPLSGEAVSLIVKGRAADAGLDPRGYSGHSLRAGFITAASLAGVASWRIRRQTGHSSDATLARYIRPPSFD